MLDGELQICEAVRKRGQKKWVPLHDKHLSLRKLIERAAAQQKRLERPEASWDEKRLRKEYRAATAAMVRVVLDTDAYLARLRELEKKILAVSRERDELKERMRASEHSVGKKQPRQESPSPFKLEVNR